LAAYVAARLHLWSYSRAGARDQRATSSGAGVQPCMQPNNCSMPLSGAEKVRNSATSTISSH